MISTENVPQTKSKPTTNSLISITLGTDMSIQIPSYHHHLPMGGGAETMATSLSQNSSFSSLLPDWSGVDWGEK